MKSSKLTHQFVTVYRLGLDLARDAEVDSVLLLLEGPTDWEEIRTAAEGQRILIAADTHEQVAGAIEAGLDVVVLDMAGHPVFAKLTQAVIQAVADDMLKPGGDVVAVYSGFEAGKIDSVSQIHLDEHLGRLTSRDLQQMETQVPLDTLKTVVDLAVAIGREGREGKAIGTMFIVGDTRKVLSQCRSGSLILWHDFAPELAKIYSWIAEVCRGVERLYRKGLLKGRILHLQDSWVGLYKVP